MKANLFDSVSLSVAVRGTFHPEMEFPAGTRGAIVEVYTEPSEAYIVDIDLPGASADDDPVTDIVTVEPSQFDVVHRHVSLSPPVAS